MVRSIMPCFVVLCVVLPARAEGDHDLATVEQHIVQKWGQHSSVRAELALQMTVGGSMTSHGNGTIEYVVSEGVEQYRMKLDTEIELGGQRVTMSRLTVCDGRVTHVLSDQLGQRLVTRQTPDQFDGRIGGAKLMAQLRRDNTLSLQRDAVVEGEPVFVIEAKSRAAKGGQPARVLLSISQKTGAILKMVGYDVSAEPTITMTYKNYEFNAMIPNQRFVFQVPEGVTVMDQTKP